MNDTKIIEIKKERLVARELNFDFGCFFYPSENKIINETRYFSLEKKDSKGNLRKLHAELLPVQKFGILTTFDERVFYVLVETWIEQKKADKCFFSLRELADKLNLSWGLNVRIAIKNSLNRLRICGILWKESFYLKKEKRHITIENPFTILNFLEVYTNKREGIGAPISCFSFDERTLSNLVQSYSRPINFNTILSFDYPLSQTVYTLLDRKLYGTNDYSRTIKGLLLDDIQLIGKSYEHKSHRIRVLEKIIPELTGVKLSYGEIITSITIENNGRSDAILRVKRTGAKKIKGKLLQTESFTKKTDIKIPESTRKALEEFDKHFNSKFEINNTPKKVVECVSLLVKEHGIEAILFSIGYIKTNLIKKSYQPDTFNGIKKYISKAVAAYKEHIKINRKKVQLTKDEQHLQAQVKKESYERDNKDKYVTYVNNLLLEIKHDNPLAYTEFLEYEQAEWIVQKSKLKSRFLLDTAKKYFNRESTRATRIQNYFNRCDFITIPDFWEWDSQANKNT